MLTEEINKAKSKSASKQITQSTTINDYEMKITDLVRKKEKEKRKKKEKKEKEKKKRKKRKRKEKE